MDKLLERIARTLRRQETRNNLPEPDTIQTQDLALAFLERRRDHLDQRLFMGESLPERQALLLEPQHRDRHWYVAGITGSGKTRFLQHLVCSHLTVGRPVWVLDPFGGLYQAALEMLATGLETAEQRGFPLEPLLDRYCFLDLRDPDNPLKVNPLEGNPLETVEHQVDDLMRALERLLGRSLEDQRRLRNIMRGVLTITAELNRLAEKERPALEQFREGRSLDLHFAADIINMSDRQRKALLATLPREPRLRFRQQYFEFFHSLTPHEKTQIVQSSWQVFQYLLDDQLVSRFFGSKTTFDIPVALRDGKSVICLLPAGENLAGSRLVGKYIATKLHHGAFRRPLAERQQQVSLIMDEFHHFADQALAEALVSLRQFGVSVTCSHQSTSQPPFDTAEGKALLRTVQANSRVKALFRLDRPDAEHLVKEIFALSQQKPNFETTDQTSGHTEQQGRTVSSGQSWSNTSGQNRSSSQSQPLDPQHHGSRGSADGLSSSTQQGGREERSETTTRGTSESQTTKMVYYTLEGERELLINQLQQLPSRQFLLSSEPLQGQLVETPFVPDSLYSYQLRDFPQELLERQRERFALPVPDLITPQPSSHQLKTEPAALAPVVPFESNEAVASKVKTSQQSPREEPVSSTPATPAAATQDEDDPFLD